MENEFSGWHTELYGYFDKTRNNTIFHLCCLCDSCRMAVTTDSNIFKYDRYSFNMFERIIFFLRPSLAIAA